MSRGLAIACVLALILVAAIAGPSLCRARPSPGVQGGVGEIRSLMMAEQVYSGFNHGYFDIPSCLASPSHCIPSYPSDAARFAEPELVSLTPRGGYSFEFHGGAKPSLSEAERAEVSPSSVTSFAVVAVPVEGQQGMRAFCGDSTGRVCARADGTMPKVEGGLCPDSCPTLR